MSHHPGRSARNARPVNQPPSMSFLSLKSTGNNVESCFSNWPFPPTHLTKGFPCILAPPELEHAMSTRQKVSKHCFPHHQTAFHFLLIFTLRSLACANRRGDRLTCIKKSALPSMHSIEALPQAYRNTRRENAPSWTQLRLHAVPEVK